MRRYKIREKAYKRVHAWLKAQKAGAGKVLGEAAHRVGAREPAQSCEGGAWEGGGLRA